MYIYIYVFYIFIYFYIYVLQYYCCRIEDKFPCHQSEPEQKTHSSAIQRGLRRCKRDTSDVSVLGNDAKMFHQTIYQMFPFQETMQNTISDVSILGTRFKARYQMYAFQETIPDTISNVKYLNLLLLRFNFKRLCVQYKPSNNIIFSIIIM